MPRMQIVQSSRGRCVASNPSNQKLVDRASKWRQVLQRQQLKLNSQLPRPMVAQINPEGVANWPKLSWWSSAWPQKMVPRVVVASGHFLVASRPRFRWRMSRVVGGKALPTCSDHLWLLGILMPDLANPCHRVLLLKRRIAVHRPCKPPSSQSTT